MTKLTSIEKVVENKTPAGAALALKVLKVTQGEFVTNYLDAVDAGNNLQRVPMSVEMISPAAACMQGCIYCSAGARTKEVLKNIKINGRKQTSVEHKKKTVIAVVDELTTMGTKGAVWSGGGDWCVYPWITDVIKYAHEKGFEDNFWISHFGARMFNEKQIEDAILSCSSIRASVDAPDTETYNKIRNPQNKNAFEIMKYNLKKFVEARAKNRSDVRLGIQMLLLEDNLGKIEEMVLLAKELGVDYIQIRPIEPTGEHYDESGEKVGIHSYDEFYANIDMFDGVAEQCESLEAEHGVQVMYREDKINDIAENGVESKPGRPAEFCDGALMQAVVEFDLAFAMPKLLHCYFRDELSIPFIPGKLADALFSDERQSCADCANSTPEKCSAGCKYVTSGFNPMLNMLRELEPTQRLITISQILDASADVEILDPNII